MEEKTHKFYVHGMHCNSCVVLTESELNDHEKVSRAVADLGTCCVEVVGNFGDQNKAK
jgi:cation transport ATPase